MKLQLNFLYLIDLVLIDSRFVNFFNIDLCMLFHIRFIEKGMNSAEIAGLIVVRLRVKDVG